MLNSPIDTRSQSRRRPLVAVVCGLLVVPLVLAASQRPTGQRTPTDVDITYAVQDAILFDASVPSSLIDVVTNQRTVTLTGAVDNLRAKVRGGCPGNC
jgi:hypothetical protein